MYSKYIATQRPLTKRLQPGLQRFEVCILLCEPHPKSISISEDVFAQNRRETEQQITNSRRFFSAHF